MESPVVETSSWFQKLKANINSWLYKTESEKDKLPFWLFYIHILSWGIIIGFALIILLVMFVVLVTLIAHASPIWGVIIVVSSFVAFFSFVVASVLRI